MITYELPIPNEPNTPVLDRYGFPWQPVPSSIDRDRRWSGPNGDSMRWRDLVIRRGPLVDYEESR